MKNLLLFIFSFIPLAILIAQTELTLSYQKTECSLGSPSGGAIVLSISGGQTPYTVLWANGDSTEYRSDLSVGTYTVSITDALNTSIESNIEIGNDVIWDDVVGLSLDGNFVSKDTMISTWYNAEMTSLNELQSGADGSLTIRFTDLRPYAMVGLTKSNDIVSYKDIDYAIYFRQYGIKIYERGILRGTYGRIKRGETVKIERVGNEIRYYKNELLIRTNVLNNNNFTLMANCNIRNLNRLSPPVWELDAWTSFGYRDLGEFKQFNKLTTTKGGGHPIVVSDNVLRFKLAERYESQNSSTNLDYGIYNWQRSELSQSIANNQLSKNKGTNWYELDLSSSNSFQSGEFYTLEVVSNNGEKSFLRFKYLSN